MTRVKICGITTPDALDAAVDAGASFLGFVFHPGSKRFIEPARAKTLTNRTPSTVMNVGLFVDPKPGDLERVLAEADLDMIQLHGSESPQQVQKIRALAGLPVIKALRPADLETAPAYEKVSDWLLFDSPGGGTGESFDWTILKGRRFAKPWMLAGGLTEANVAQALSVLKPDAVDVSSGAEDAPGIKSPEKIRKFIESVKNHDQKQA